MTSRAPRRTVMTPSPRRRRRTMMHSFPLSHLIISAQFFEADSAEKKARGRLTEVNNGRLAMLGIFSIISEATVPGSVPALKDMIPPYDGNVMIPFSGDFSIFS